MMCACACDLAVMVIHFRDIEVCGCCTEDESARIQRPIILVSQLLEVHSSLWWRVLRQSYIFLCNNDRYAPDIQLDYSVGVIYDVPGLDQHL